MSTWSGERSGTMAAWMTCGPCLMSLWMSFLSTLANRGKQSPVLGAKSQNRASTDRALHLHGFPQNAVLLRRLMGLSFKEGLLKHTTRS